MSFEPEVRDFLKRIMFTIGAGLGWLLINMTAGIFAGWFFFNTTPTKGNIIFYVWLAVSLAFLLRFYFRLWSKQFPHG